MALRASIAAGDLDWEEALVLAHHRLTRSDREPTDEFEARHKDHHMALLAACGSPILLRFCGQLYDLNVRYRYLAGTAKSYSNRHVEEEHRAILDAAIDRDIEKASDLLRTHCRNTGEFLSELIDRGGGGPPAGTGVTHAGPRRFPPGRAPADPLRSPLRPVS